MEKKVIIELEKKMKTETEEEEEEKEEDDVKGKNKELGGLKTMPSILAIEIFDRISGSGFHANLITYLTQVLNLPLVKASNTTTNFGGISSFTTLIGAFVADSFAGQFWTIAIGSTIYVLGMATLTISAVLPLFRPPPCPTQVNCKEASNMQLWVLYISLLLISLGSGGIKPCVVTFAADQFDTSKSSIESRSWNFFNWYYFCMGMATFLSLTIVVYIQDNISWAWGLGVPAIAMALSVVAFIMGFQLYRIIRPRGSPFVRLAQVLVASVRKRKVVAAIEPSDLYENRELDADISTKGRLLHSNQFKWFDRAAVVADSDMKVSNQPNLWRLATVHRVEELKTIIRILPIWAAYIMVVASYSHQNTFIVQQARTMDRHLSPSFQIPPASMKIFNTLTILIGIPLYERLFVPFSRRFTGNPVGISCLQRMGIGFGINILATCASALIEIKRKAVAADNNLLDEPTAIIPISVFWLLPQYCLHGLAEVFMAIGHMEFLYDQSPESMRSTVVSMNWTTTSIGNYVSTLMVTLVHKYTGQEMNWLPDQNLNRGRLENYYWLLTGVQMINLIYYVICAWFYKYKQVKEITETESTDEDVESSNIRQPLLIHT